MQLVLRGLVSELAHLQMPSVTSQVPSDRQTAVAGVDPTGQLFGAVHVLPTVWPSQTQPELAGLGASEGCAGQRTATSAQGMLQPSCDGYC